MSRSNPNESLVNPASRFYQWSGDAGAFKYYDKSKGEKGENVTVPVSPKKPFTFLVLETCHTIKGYSDADQSGFWSNEVKDLRKEILNVRTAKGPVASGLYENISDKIKALGAKYCQSVYVGIKGDSGELEIQNIQLTGAALSEWLDFCKNNKVMEIAVQVKSTEEKKKGKTVYQVPVFEALKVSEKTNNDAIELDKQLQEFLKEYFAKNTMAAPSQEETPEVLKEPVKESKSSAKAPVKEESVDIIDNTDNDLDDMPF